MSTCETCDGDGFIVTCIDDMCVGMGYCIHGDGDTTCPECHGRGEIDDDNDDDPSATKSDRINALRAELHAVKSALEARTEDNDRQANEIQELRSKLAITAKWSALWKRSSNFWWRYATREDNADV